MHNPLMKLTKRVGSSLSVPAFVSYKYRRASTAAGSFALNFTADQTVFGQCEKMCHCFLFFSNSMLEQINVLNLWLFIY